MDWWVPLIGALVVGSLAFRRDAEAAVQRGNDDPREADGERQQDIAQKIQDELTYPGQIKVVVIREMRTTSVAK